WQRFARDAEILRRGTPYRFVADAGPPKPPARFRGTPRLVESIASFEPDVAHVNGLDHPRFLRALRRRPPASCARVVQDHGGFDPRDLTPLRRAWMRRGLAAADALLVATAPHVDLFRASGLVPANLIVRDVMEGSSTLSASTHRPWHTPLSLLWVGRLN